MRKRDAASLKLNLPSCFYIFAYVCVSSYPYIYMTLHGCSAGSLVRRVLDRLCVGFALSATCNVRPLKSKLLNSNTPEH